MKRIGLIVPLMAAMVLMTGCESYRWTSEVPEELRTVAVPTFINETNMTELGNVVTRQVLREFQREGTFKIRRAGDSALEVQGVIKECWSKAVAYNRRVVRYNEYEMQAIAVVSVIDKRSGKVLVNDRHYVARTTFLAHDDIMTGSRDSEGRIGEDLARQIVDDVLAINYDSED